MSQPVPAPLKKTPLNARHRALGARMVEFGGWDMPVEYSGIVDEHMAVRQAAGLFDVSHMGEFEFEGPGALDFLQRVTSNNVAKLAPGQAQYSALTLPNGAPADDVILYPGHDYGPTPTSSLADQRRTNRYLRIRSLDDWMSLMGGSPGF